MNVRPLRVGVIGCGEIAESHVWVIQGDRPPREEPTRSLKDVLRRGQKVARRLLGRKDPPPRPGIEGIQIIAASEVDPERLAAFSQRFDIPHTYRSYRDLLARKDVDAVLVCTPPSVHAEIVLEAARQGKHIFCEKPMAMTSADCRRMVNAAKEAGVILQIGYVLRFSSERGRIRDAILNGEIGRPVFFRETGTLRAGAGQRWVHDQELGGGILWEYSHALDFIRHVFGEPELVFGIGGRYKPDKTSALDTIGVSLTFPSGDQAVFTDSYALRGFGGRKFGARRERVLLDVMGPKGFAQFPDGDLARRLTICVYGDPEDRVEKMPWRNDWGANGYRKEFEHFFECVREGKPSAVPGEEGLRTVQLLEAAFHSMRTGEVSHFARDVLRG